MTLRRNGARIRKALDFCDLDKSIQQLLRNSPPFRVLGIDINTNSTGFVVVTERGRVCRWGYIPTDHFASSNVMAIGGAIDDFLAKVQAAELELQQQENARWIVGIEAFMRMFRSGRYHNAGIFQLAQLNGIVSFACWKRFGSLPLHTHPSAARSFHGLCTSSVNSKSGSIKHQVMTFLKQQEPELTQAASCDSKSSCVFPTFQRNRNGSLADSAFDIADAYVMASYTRCMYFKTLLQTEQPQLLETFSQRYLELTHKAATKTKNVREIKIIETMNEKEKQAYTQDLFAYGLEKWFKEHKAQLYARE
ncbi:uncharacterized protein PHALS_01418 [Plasmopara halstedii]|uniref:Uncharacterized protein n=1 Tax=Plasmopara halstedii TaxID=4781 RepID=A0A0P1AWW1_PLAHL|nr:uncharacterized protein PHALS_01418 [Plasmopara halstedii]CEG45094.1 hypothetical protein PHALS_01418 [Plasmopara halstedii]|eukprot:XP_024581463.1 hypothetical protein PHALS_01418 [Plasmopara halstedii]